MRLTQVYRFPERLLSTVQRGTAFEYRALALLTKHMSMSLTRVGGSYDGGVDLIGWWWVPSSKENPPTTHLLDATAAPTGSTTIANRRRLRVLAQCKAEKRKMGPAYLRELEGVVYKYAAAAATTGIGILPHESESESESTRVPQVMVPNDGGPTAAKDPPPIALLISQSAFTRHCLLAAHASPLPFLLVHIPPPSQPPSRPPANTKTSGSKGGGGGSSAIGAVFGNPALVSSKGVLGGELDIRWERGGSDVPSSQSLGMLGDASAGRPRLWWQGQPLPSWTPEAGAGVDGDGVVLSQTIQ